MEEHNYKANIKFDTLTDWKDNANDAIKYYAGTAVYRKTFNLKDKLNESDKVVLSLGNVSIAAEVIVNGQNAGVLWIAPFTIDITQYLTKGENKLEVKVTNQWTNRLIGDERFPKQDDGYGLSSYNPQENSEMPDWYLNNEPMPKGPRTTFDGGLFYKKNDELLSAGLLGPVNIFFKKEKKIIKIMKKHIKSKFLYLVILSLCISNSSIGQTATISKQVELNFKSPPNSVKPRTWMHAMSGNMSKDGMTKDLEAIAAAGQGGILLFNVANGIPYGDVPYDSAKHHEIIKHAAQECERLNLAFGVHNCDGWSSSGGPWIKPEESMKIIVHSEAVINVKQSAVKIKLEQPTTREGYYEDIAVLAYPSLKSEMVDAIVKPVVTASDPKFNIAVVMDKRAEKTSMLNMAGKEKPWIQYDFGNAHTIQSLHIILTNRSTNADLEVSDNGQDFKKVKKMFKTRTEKSEYSIVESFKPITARYFRILFSESANIKEIELKSTHLVNNYIGFSGRGFTGTSELNMITNPDASMIIKKGDIVNLTQFLKKDGTLETTLPMGDWTIMRFGQTSAGVKNSPASKWGKGLECDKLSRPAFKKHWDNFAQEVIDNTKKIAPNALQYIEIDSYEMGGQNWTDGFDAIYKKEKGYDIIDFLPLFAGRYVEDLNTTKRVLWDLNDILCDLMTKNYYEYFTELCHENGVKSYTEPYGKGHVNQFDVTGVTDLPMTEFWVGRDHNYVPSVISGAHIYGKNIISAEAFTSQPELNWKMHPALAKSSGDKAWAEGVNEFMFHRYAHQANTHVKPGMTMGIYGSHIDRTQTWWMNAGKSWFEYIARGSSLLRQGYPVVDVLVFAGDNSHNANVLPEKFTVKVPAGFNYDCTNADVLINRITLKDKKMLLPEGNAYSCLILQDVAYIKLPTLRRIKEIADAGVIIIGDKPKSLAGYSFSAAQEEEFNKLVSEIWKSPSYKKDFDFNTLQADLVLVDKKQLFTHRKTENEDIYFFNNETDKTEKYECVFRVKNKIPELWNAETGQITKLAQFKNEENGTRVWLELKALESAFVVFRESSVNVNSITKSDSDSAVRLNDKNKLVVISNENGTQKVQLANGKTLEVQTKELPKSIDISSEWSVEFLKENDFASKEKFKSLTDWKDNEKEGIKHYSGTAEYTKLVKLDQYKADTNVILDLGNVSVVAEVFVNDKQVGVLWKAPFKINISDFIKKGENQIKVKITNQWVNRLIGDENYPAQDGGFVPVDGSLKDDHAMPSWYINNEPMPKGPRTTFTTLPFYKKGDSLLPSGLLGPVKITFEQEKKID